MLQEGELLLLKILNFILAIFIPIMMKLTKYYDKLVIKKEMKWTVFEFSEIYFIRASATSL